MRKLSLLLLLTVFVNSVFSQSAIDARNGYTLPVYGEVRVFSVFVEVTGDPQYYTMQRSGWQAGQMPVDPNQYQSFISKYYDEASDIDGNGTIVISERIIDLGKIKYNGIELDASHFRFLQYTRFGSVFDAYYQGDKISISTNPAPMPWLTERPAANKNSKIYLNGLSIRVVEQRANGDVKICIRWKDYDVKNNVRWCGDIVLNEKVNLLSGSTILLDHGLTPIRQNNPVTFNGKQVFSSPTIFTGKQGSLFKANSGSTIHLKNKSALIAESGSQIELDGANLIVESVILLSHIPVMVRL